MGLKKILRTLYEDVILENLPRKRKWKYWNELPKDERDIWESNKWAMEGVNEETTQFHPPEQQVTLIKNKSESRAIVNTIISYVNPDFNLTILKPEFEEERYYLGGKEVSKEEAKEKIKKWKNIFGKFGNKKNISSSEVGSVSLVLSTEEFDAKNVREEDGQIKFDIGSSKKKKKELQ